MKHLKLFEGFAEDLKSLIDKYTKEFEDCCTPLTDNYPYHFNILFRERGRYEITIKLEGKLPNTSEYVDDLKKDLEEFEMNIRGGIFGDVSIDYKLISVGYNDRGEWYMGREISDVYGGKDALEDFLLDYIVMKELDNKCIEITIGN